MCRIHIGKVAIAAGARILLSAHSRTPPITRRPQQVTHCAVGMFRSAEPAANVGHGDGEEIDQGAVQPSPRIALDAGTVGHRRGEERVEVLEHRGTLKSDQRGRRRPYLPAGLIRPEEAVVVATYRLHHGVYLYFRLNTTQP
jgi:hypothetical protein